MAPRNRSRDRVASSRGRPARQQESGPRIRWRGFRPMLDFWGKEIKRFYQLETLASATERMIRTRDRFLIPSIQEVMGPAPVTSLHFELFQEGKYQLIFRLEAANAKRKEAAFAFVAAKHHEAYSAVARAEHQHLRILHERVPIAVVKPFRGGPIYLPDRHQRAGHGREIYAYVTQWLHGFHELGVSRSLQFFINVPRPHTFTVAQTEALKARMVEILVRTYDARKRDCMDLPQIASGDFVVTYPARGTSTLKLIACRRLLSRVTPAKLIHRIVGACWEWNERELRLMPADPELFVEAFVRALGKDQAKAWFQEYRAAVGAGRLSEQDVLPLEELAALGFC